MSEAPSHKPSSNEEAPIISTAQKSTMLTTPKPIMGIQPQSVRRSMSHLIDSMVVST